MTDLGAHVGPGACGTCERVRKDRLEALVSGTFVEPSTDTKKTNWPLVGRMWKGSGWELPKTVNSERARTDPMRTYVPGNGRQAPA